MEPPMDAIAYALESQVDPNELLGFYQAQRHRAVPQSPEKLQERIEHSACFVTARDGQGKLIGLARGLADGVRGYLTECKLDVQYQGPGAVTKLDGRIEHDERGIAREMGLRVLDKLREIGCQRIDVIAHGTEVEFCAELGFRRNSGAVAMTINAVPQTVVAGASSP